MKYTLISSVCSRNIVNHLFCICFLVCLLLQIGKCGFCSEAKEIQPYCETRHDEERNSERLICNGGLPKKFYQLLSNPRALTICQVSKSYFDPTIVSLYPLLHRFSLINSNITYFTTDFPHHHYIQILNLTRLNLVALQIDLFGKLSALRVLDLSYNKLTNFDRHLVAFLPNFQQLYLRGNQFDCNSDIKWVSLKRTGSMARRIMDLDEMRCSGLQYLGKPLSRVMHFKRIMDSQCPRVDTKCKCILDNLVWPQNDQDDMIPIITVNCSYLGLKTLPLYLPSNTTRLFLIGNNITDLRPMIHNPHYYHVADIYLDRNQIDSIAILEGSAWFSQFRVFSVRNNKINKLPWYAFDHSLTKNSHLLSIYLSENPWICDCMFTPGFKELIVKYRHFIKDNYNIRCAKETASHNSLKVIRDLPLSSICLKVDDTWLSPIQILNIVLFVLILFILIKFAYDCWRFKTKGKLPWIIMKLP